MKCKRFTDKELIIFDLDGTLINSIPDLTLATNKMLKHYKLPPLTMEEATPYIGNGAKALVERALNHTTKEQSVSENLTAEALEIYFKAYEEAPCNDTFLYPGVKDTLVYLNKKGYRMVICTNKPFQFIEPILECLSIKHFFESWIGADSLAKQKPEPDPLLYFTKKTKIPVEKTIMIGDSKNDILAARNANMHSIGFTYGYNYNENIADYKPTVVANSFSELKRVF
ncbi:phosphoglycolate phosphatase [Balneicella halophila]|uniref:phosphoglycolate phosphatase n=1 Tax=Balneicella halophila TaxID=1537566 RepID=A0A7L4UQJ9_BALHA|nr:phosphoglycolate phosphatase [Balneicella halophila]PVX51949.1 phosphoglycolate phosphatase [Balneicella halophila]